LNLDERVCVLSERQLCRVLKEYLENYHNLRTGANVCRANKTPLDASAFNSRGDSHSAERKRGVGRRGRCLVDQEQGTLWWQTSSGIQDYYIYFDTLIHTGHPLPETGTFPAASLTSQADDIARCFIASRTRFDRIQTHLEHVRSELAAAIAGVPDCSGNVVSLSGRTFYPGVTTNCVAHTSMTIGPSVTLQSGADLVLTAPLSRFQPPFQMDVRAALTVRAPNLP